MTNFEKCHFAHCSSAVNTKLQLSHNIVIDDAPPAHIFKTSQLNEPQKWAGRQVGSVLVNCPSRWSLHLSLVLYFDHLSIIPKVSRPASGLCADVLHTLALCASGNNPVWKWILLFFGCSSTATVAVSQLLIFSDYMYIPTSSIILKSISKSADKK